MACICRKTSNYVIDAGFSHNLIHMSSDQISSVGFVLIHFSRKTETWHLLSLLGSHYSCGICDVFCWYKYFPNITKFLFDVWSPLLPCIFYIWFWSQHNQWLVLFHSKEVYFKINDIIVPILLSKNINLKQKWLGYWYSYRTIFSNDNFIKWFKQELSKPTIFQIIVSYLSNSNPKLWPIIPSIYFCSEIKGFILSWRIIYKNAYRKSLVTVLNFEHYYFHK